MAGGAYSWTKKSSTSSFFSGLLLTSVGFGLMTSSNSVLSTIAIPAFKSLSSLPHINSAILKHEVKLHKYPKENIS